jgi:hypothetical protein
MGTTLWVDIELAHILFWGCIIILTVVVLFMVFLDQKVAFLSSVLPFIIYGLSFGSTLVSPSFLNVFWRYSWTDTKSTNVLVVVPTLKNFLQPSSANLMLI